MSFNGMLHRRIELPVDNTYISVATTGDKAFVHPGAPLQLVRWGFISTTAVTGSPKFEVDLRPQAGSDTNRVAGVTTQIAATTGYNANGQPALYSDAAGGTLTPGAISAGQGVFHDMNPQTGSGSPQLYPPYATNQPEDTQLVVFPGQELVFKVATAAGAGAGIVFFEFIEKPLQYDRLGQFANTISGPVPSNPAANLTKFFS